jgi:hypothetical protein
MEKEKLYRRLNNILEELESGNVSEAKREIKFLIEKVYWK